MKFDYDQTFLTYRGNPYTTLQVVRGKDGKAVFEDGKVKTEEIILTLREVILTLTENRLEEDNVMSSLEIVNLGSAGIAAMRNQPLSESQISMLKNRVDKFYPNPLLDALVLEVLDAGEFSDDAKEVLRPLGIK